MHERIESTKNGHVAAPSSQTHQRQLYYGSRWPVRARSGVLSLSLSRLDSDDDDDDKSPDCFSAMLTMKANDSRRIALYAAVRDSARTVPRARAPSSAGQLILIDQCRPCSRGWPEICLPLSRSLARVPRGSSLPIQQSAPRSERVLPACAMDAP